MDKIKLRKFPYPYQAALAICSDIDGMSWDNFLEIHRFLNTKQDTQMGEGLELPIGDSFWMYDQPDLADSSFSYFEDSKGKESNIAPMMRDFIHAGILDVMHSYGNFATMGDFSRKHAIQAIEKLLKYDLKIKVWTNHGGMESIQNIGIHSWGKGDIPTHEGNGTDADLDCYHSDLLMDYGVQFYWDCEKSLTSMVGQDVPVRFSEAYWRSPLYSGFKLKVKSIIKGYFSFADLLYYRFNKKHFVPWQPFDPLNYLIEFDELRDGNILLKFKRFGNGRLDWSDDLYFLLNDKVLNHLIEKQGYLILYIHLGNQKVKTNSLPLPKITIEKFIHLAELYHSGKIWIETTSRLLTYNWIYHTIKWSVEETETNYYIHIKGIDTEYLHFELSLKDLSGLTFIAPRDKKVTVLFNNRSIHCTVQTDTEKKQQFVMIPLLKLDWPL